MTAVAEPLQEMENSPPSCRDLGIVRGDIEPSSAASPMGPTTDLVWQESSGK